MTAFRVPASAGSTHLPSHWGKLGSPQGRNSISEAHRMYSYRNLTPEQQNEVVEYRRQQRRPWHSPPHWNFEGETQFFISGACYEHARIIGASHERMTECENDLLEVSGITRASFTPGVSCRTITTLWSKPTASMSCVKRSAGSTGARHSNGTAKTSAAGGRSGITALTARSNRIAISGRP